MPNPNDGTTYTLAQIRNGTGFPKDARFRMVAVAAPPAPPPEGLREIAWHDRTQEDVSGETRGTWGEYQPQGHRAFHVWPPSGDPNADTLYLFDDEVDFNQPAEVSDGR